MANKCNTYFTSLPLRQAFTYEAWRAAAADRRGVRDSGQVVRVVSPVEHLWLLCDDLRELAFNIQHRGYQREEADQNREHIARQVQPLLIALQGSAHLTAECYKERQAVARWFCFRAVSMPAYRGKLEALAEKLGQEGQRLRDAALVGGR